MASSTLNQLSNFLIFIICGAIIGIFFDIFRILRKTFKTPDWLTYIEDILFWIGTGIILLFALFKFNNGQIRSYNLIGLIIGVILYILLISSIFIKINVKILTKIKKTFIFIFSICIYPIKIIFKLLKKPTTFLVINIKKVAKIPKKYIKRPKKAPKVEKSKKRCQKRRILTSDVEKYK